jgi:hypothetical protein
MLVGLDQVRNPNLRPERGVGRVVVDERKDPKGLGGAEILDRDDLKGLDDLRCSAIPPLMPDLEHSDPEQE